MKLLELNLRLPAANIALDEALLEQADQTASHPEVLRLWEPSSNMVVIGRSSPIEQEVNLDFCRTNQIPIYRRCSGGASIVTGPGCLMYAVLLDYRKRESLRMLEKAHQFVMGQMSEAIHRLDVDVQMQGTSDLTWNDRKFSGNSLRCKKNWMIYHGTILCDFDLPLISKCLGNPIRQPEYRRGRTHEQFLTQLPIPTTSLRQAIREQWSVTQTLEESPIEMAQQLVSEKYASEAWTFKVRTR